MRRLIRTVVVLAAVASGAVLLWRRNPRAGTRLMNERIDPYLLRHNVSEGAHSEIATLEHVGRRSGRVRLTLVHPVPIEGGFRVMLPIGSRSEWARNVLAAGHCRMSLQGTVYELDEPALRSPSEVPGLRPFRRLAERALGFAYLELHRFAEHPGTLEVAAPEVEVPSAGEESAPPAAGRPVEGKVESGPAEAPVPEEAEAEPARW